MATRLEAQHEIVRRHRDQQVKLAELQSGVLARSAEIHDEVARVHESLPAAIRKISPQEARDHAELDRERSVEETRHAEAARQRRAAAEADSD